MIQQIIILLVGFIFLVKGADWFVDGAASIARKMGIPQLIIGLTIVAMGTSMPEAAVSITAAMQQNAGITIGNVVGSNILNIFIILGITALITNVKIQKSTIYLFIMARNSETQEEKKDIPVWKCLLFILLGGILVVKGSDFAVSGASAIARYFGMSERFIGLTIVAFGTSLPELVTSVTAAKRGNAGIAIGNIVGSNIFNILFVIGTTSLICSVPFESKFMIDSMIAVIAGLVLWFGTMKHQELRKPCGIIMLLCYGLYFMYLCLM